jgi:calcium-dependent protein kinase
MGQCCSIDAVDSSHTKKKKKKGGDNGSKATSSSGRAAGAELKHMESSSILHSNLVREQHVDFHKIYTVVDLIGEGSISNISKIKKKQSAIGGSSRPDFVESQKHRHLKKSDETKPKSLSGKLAKTTSGTKNALTSNHQPEYYALKEIDLSFVKKEYVDELRNEVELLKSLDHPNIIKIYETFKIKKRLAIVMELCSGGDLYKRNPYTEAQAANIVRQVLSAVAYLHDRNIIHRDIKYENIMFESKDPNAQVKLIDFGLAKVYLDRPMTERVGTLYTMAPSVIRGHYSSKADLWSVGVVAYMLMSGEKPFWSKTRTELMAQIVRAQYSFHGPHWKHISKEGKSFIKKLLVVNSDDRMSAKEALNHPWLKSNTDWSREKPSSESMTNVKANLVRYADSPEFKKLALLVIAKKSTSEEIFELRRIFDEMDTENTGTVTYEEFRTALQDLNYSDSEIKSMFDRIDFVRAILSRCVTLG